MYVNDKMTKDVVVVDPYQTISEVLDLMNNHKIHRVPVIDGEKLVGLITEGVVLKNTPSNASTLSMHEMNYLLSKTKIKDIMIKSVITISPDALLEEAADCMEKNDIGCLPVVDESKHLLGILTTNDILKSFAQLSGFYQPGTRVVVEFEEDGPGLLSKLTKVFHEAGINLTHLTAQKNGTTQIVIRCDETDKECVRDLLTKNGFNVVSLL